MPNQHTGAIMSHLSTLKDLTESIRCLQSELNCFWDPCTEKLNQSSLNLTAVPTTLPSISDNIPVLSLSPDEFIRTLDPEDAHLATFFDNAIYHVPHICMSQISASKASLIDSYYRHESNIASLDRFFYSTAFTLYRLVIG